MPVNLTHIYLKFYCIYPTTCNRDNHQCCSGYRARYHTMSATRPVLCVRVCLWVNCQIILTIFIRKGFTINHLANGLIWEQHFGLKSNGKVRNLELHNPNSIEVGMGPSTDSCYLVLSNRGKTAIKQNFAQ